MQKQGKAWGWTACLIKRPSLHLHRIEVVKGGYCSTHKHLHRWNWFYVESGKLGVTEKKNGTGTVDTTTLEAGDSCLVPPGNLHSFEALEDCVAFEAYWAELDGSDIERDSVGGIKGEQLASK